MVLAVLQKWLMRLPKCLCVSTLLLLDGVLLELFAAVGCLAIELGGNSVVMSCVLVAILQVTAIFAVVRYEVS